MNNSTALQEVTVDSSGVSAELATGGVRINLIPREGSNTFKGSFFGSYTNACRLAAELLFKAGDAEAVDEACKRSFRSGPRWLT